jgi:DNA-binding transcriptional regulator YhcF (GntR family)
MTPESSALDIRIDRHGDLPVGMQLTRGLRALIESGALAVGDRLPSIRELAPAMGVNVNTVRAAYARLEQEGLVQTEHGRGSFVSRRPTPEVATRRELRRQIAELEAELVRRPRPPAAEAEEPPPRSAGALLTTRELERVRDDLHRRLQELDDARYEVLQRLSALDQTAPPSTERASRTTPSLAGARVRFVGVA